ncbi:TIGR02453 family protein [Luteitalea sp. TBR-22]|uniref:DUF2461 family protein n=1 Tax=Luteitalea sp. TBR-22 TaxID=2802971 RepID=UPI001AF5FD00|nr:DUF2461 family protein [Luteitalea sp. TBR-22]BCS31132.1 TIGR02453 family protein [Luteitalea sp. TBR-22]
MSRARPSTAGHRSSGAGHRSPTAGTPAGARRAGIAEFEGFPRDTVTFLRALARNNTEEWLEANRARYEAAILTPARQCVVAVGEALHAAGCRVVADPRVNGSIFRMARDRRFRPDAPPYKTHLALIWWAEGVRMAQPSFYLQINGKGLELGVGLPEVPRERLPAVRRWLAEGDHAARLLRAMDVSGPDAPTWELRELARPPAEFRGLTDEAARRAVRFIGGWGGWTLTTHPPELFTAEFPAWLVGTCRPLLPFFHVFEEALSEG